RMRYWVKGSPPKTVEAHTPTPLPFSSPGPWQEATLTGLPPGAEVQYELGNPTRPVPLAFRAPPPRGGFGFTFAAVGDMGAAIDSPSTPVTHRLISLAEPMFVIGLG